jgi:hypothetical protein
VTARPGTALELRQAGLTGLEVGAELPARVQWGARRAGWRRPPGVVYIGRGRGAHGRWGNPLCGPAAAMRFGMWLVGRHLDGDERTWLGIDYPSVAELRAELAGRTLACWCCVDAACHGDPLRLVANGPADLLAQLSEGSSARLLAVLCGVS